MKEIKGFNGKYLIDTMGNVFSAYKTKENKKIKMRVCKANGYVMFKVTYKGKQYTRTLHSVMAETYLGLERNDFNKTVNHIDGNKLNNSLGNLEIISRGDNIRHAFKTGLMTTCHKVKYQGIVYYSKSEMRRELHISERKQNKMIEKGEVIEI